MGDCKLKCNSCGKEEACEGDSCGTGASCCGTEMEKVCEPKMESDEEMDDMEEESENGGGCCGGGH